MEQNANWKAALKLARASAMRAQRLRRTRKRSLRPLERKQRQVCDAAPEVTLIFKRAHPRVAFDDENAPMTFDHFPHTLGVEDPTAFFIELD